MTAIDYSKVFKKIGQNDQQGLFALTKSVLVYEMGGVDSSDRCDYDNYGPQGLTWQENSDEPFGVPWVPTVGHLQTFEIVLDFAPHFYIIYIEIPEVKATSSLRPFSYSDSKYETTTDTARLWCARTIQELLKNMIEWSSVYGEPFENREAMSVYSKYCLEVMNIPQTILDEINTVPNMHLYRYLNGDILAQQRPSNIPDVSDGFIDWFKNLTIEKQAREIWDIY